MSDSEWWKHVDHDLAQLVALHRAFLDPSFLDLPEVARRAMDVAYGIHMRAILEFAHSGPPRKKDYEVLPDEPRHDISSSELLGRSLRSSWTPEELTRMRDANALIGHLAAGRVPREGSETEWGDEQDLAIWREVAEEMFGSYAEHLPRAFTAWRELMETLDREEG